MKKNVLKFCNGRSNQTVQLNCWQIITPLESLVEFKTGKSLIHTHSVSLIMFICFIVVIKKIVYFN